MIDALIFISQRPVVIALAIIGAIFVVAGGLTGAPQQRSGVRDPIEIPGDTVDRANAWSKRLTQAGYAITFASIALFIVAGFVSDLRS